MNCETSETKLINEALREIFSKLIEPINGKIAPKNQLTKFKCLISNQLYEDEYSSWFKEKSKFQRDFSIRKISTRSEEKQLKIRKEIALNIKLANQKVSSILKFQDIEEENGSIYVTYESCESTLEKFLKENIKKLDPKKFLEILKGIINAVGNLHLKEIILKNVKSSNMAYCLDDNNSKIKIINLLEAEEISKVDRNSFLNDIKQVGILLFSAVTKAEELEKNLENLEKFEKSFILPKIMDLECIEKYKKESFVDLIIALIEAKDSSIQSYLTNPFFWDDTKVEECIKVTNSWIDKNSKVSIKGMSTKFDEEFKYENWKQKITEAEVKQAITSGFGNTGGELLRFIRNRVVHRKDYKEEAGQYLNSKGPFEYFFIKYDDFFYKLTTFYINNNPYEPQKADVKPAPATKNDSSKINQPVPERSHQKMPRTSSYSGNPKAVTNKFTDTDTRNDVIRNEQMKEKGNSSKNIFCYSNKKQNKGSYYKPGSKRNSS